MADPGILFITGTDTGVGKTVLSVLLVRHLLRRGTQVVALKPIASGGRGDARALYEAQERRVPLDRINPWHFRGSLAPPLAARREGRAIRLSPVLRHLRACQKQHPLLIVEGAGGLLSPLGEDFDSRDLVTALHATPVLVAQNRLGSVHQVRTTLSALPKVFQRRAVVVLSNPPQLDAATRQNADLLFEFEPEVRQITLPWSPRWREQSAPSARATRKVMGELLCLLRVPAGDCGPSDHADGPRR